MPQALGEVASLPEVAPLPTGQWGCHLTLGCQLPMHRQHSGVQGTTDCTTGHLTLSPETPAPDLLPGQGGHRCGRVRGHVVGSSGAAGSVCSSAGARLLQTEQDFCAKLRTGQSRSPSGTLRSLPQRPPPHHCGLDWTSSGFLRLKQTILMVKCSQNNVEPLVFPFEFHMDSMVSQGVRHN